MSMKTASILVINDEILQSAKSDDSTKFLVQELNLLQYSVEKVTVLPESEGVVSNEIGSLAKYYDIVVTVGGTKNGVLYRAIGKLFSQELDCRRQLENVLKKLSTSYDKNEICIPVAAKLITSDVYPLIYYQRIFMLTEEHLEETFLKILKPHIWQYRKEPLYLKAYKITVNGNSSNTRQKIDSLARDGVTVESTEEDHTLTIKVSSPKLPSLVRFEEEIQEKLQINPLNFIEPCNSWEDIYHSNDIHVKKSIETIEKCLLQYGPGNVFISFNGGKDCTVLLHLILVVLRYRFSNYEGPVFCLYVQSKSPFPEQDEFIKQCKIYYNLKIITIQSDIKAALEEILSNHSNYKACFMGTRHTDPFSDRLNSFQVTDPTWPRIMRVSPLLEWCYSDIWDYLLYYKVPYCELYNMGFTSLGNTVNTIRNPTLSYYNVLEEKETYLPAYKLLEEGNERQGRKN